MRTKAFLIRVTICFLLSLIPATELENLIYSGRLKLRGEWGKAQNIIIVDIDSPSFNRPNAFRDIQSRLLAREAKLVIAPARYNNNDLVVDWDGTIRSARILPNGGPSATYTAFLQMRFDPKNLKRPTEPHLINYIGSAGSFPRCSIAEVFSKSTPHCADLRNKIVLMNEITETPYLFRTPLGEMGRTEIVANEINTIINRYPIYRISWLERVLISLAMILLGAFYIIYYPIWLSAIAVAATGFFVIVVLFQIIFHYFSVYIPSANISGAILVTYLIFTGYRLAVQEHLQWRTFKQAQYLREMDQMKTNFLSLVSHDLKTPLAKIQAVAERLRRELHLPSEQRSDWKELLDSIESSNKELRHYIGSILNLSKIESQKVILNKKSNDINLIIQQALKRLKPVASQKNIVIEEILEPLFSIECDEDLMRQVVTNLIDNAIKYSPPNSKVIVRSREEEGFVRVEVEDFGPGIPKSQLPLMFRKFNRFLRPMNAQVKGTGLGLYLSKYFIELHGGTIGLRSVEGQGTTSTFTLPLSGSENEAILG